MNFTFCRRFFPVVVACSLFLAAAPLVAAAEEADELEQDEVSSCEDGPSNKDWLFSMLGVVVGTVGMSFVGWGTLSRSLARSGHRQSSANMAGMGFGALVGGSIGAGIMGARECGVGTAPGYIGASLATLGLIVLVFSVATGKNR